MRRWDWREVRLQVDPGGGSGSVDVIARVAGSHGTFEERSSIGCLAIEGDPPVALQRPDPRTRLETRKDGGQVSGAHQAGDRNRLKKCFRGRMIAVTWREGTPGGKSGMPKAQR